MNTILEFLQQHPEYAFDWTRPIKYQPRIFDPEILNSLPEELIPVQQPYVPGEGTGNRNQTRTHYQCTSCNRILLNSAFPSPKSFVSRNRVYSFCKQCHSKLNAGAYDVKASSIAARRRAIWQHLTKDGCVACKWHGDISAFDMHHVTEGKSESVISELITRVTLAPTINNVERLLVEASKTVPVCCRCHRLIHSGVTALGPDVKPQRHRLDEFLDLLMALEDAKPE